MANPKEEEERRTAAAAEKQNKPAAQPATAGQPTAETPAVASAIAEKSTLSPNRAVTAEKSPAKTESKSPAKSPAKADAKSPAKSPAKKDDNTIELKKDANGLGIGIVGGSDTPLVLNRLHFKSSLCNEIVLFREGSLFMKCTRTERRTKMAALKLAIS